MKVLLCSGTLRSIFYLFQMDWSMLKAKMGAAICCSLVNSETGDWREERKRAVCAQIHGVLWGADRETITALRAAAGLE